LYNHFLGDPDWITKDLDRYRKTSLKAVLESGQKYLQKKSRVEVITLPASEAAAQPPAAPAVAAAAPDPAPPEAVAFPIEEFRARRPEAGPARPLVPPEIERFSLPNGVQVYLVERHMLPTVWADLTFDGGPINDPAGKEGLADLCMNVLDDGTEKLDKFAFEEALGDLASNVSAYTSIDQQGLRMRTLTKSLDATLELWAGALLTPGMRQADFDRDLAQTLASLKQSKGAPASLAGRLFGNVFYGTDHPVGQVSTEASLQAVTLADCKAYVADWLKPAGAQMYVVGDVSRAEIERRFGARLASWQGQPKPSVALDQPRPRDAKIVFVDVPGAAQSQIYLGHAGPKRLDPDYFPTRIMVSILAGDFSSRVNMNLREDKGWAYGAGGGVRYYRTFGSFRVGASVRTDVTKDSVLELYKEVQKMSGGEVADAELAREKSAAVLGLPAQFATGADVMSSYRTLVYFGLPLDYWARFVENVSAVTREAVSAAAKAHLRPAQLTVLVVGDGKSVLPGLRELIESEALGQGALITLDADGKVVPASQGD
jgi:zinc protease